MDLEGIILSEVTHSQRNSHNMYSLISGYQPRNLGYPRYKIQFAKRMKLKKNEDQSVDTLPLLRIENKTPMEGVTKFGAETKGWTVQRLPYLGIHLIISLQMLHHCIRQQDFAERIQIQLSLVRLCWGLANTQWMLTVSYWMDHRAPNGGARESTQGAKGICNPIGGTTL